MKILICPDKFKESLSAAEAARYLANGILKAIPQAECKILPLADGGEGTAEVLTLATGGHFEQAEIHDPLMRIISAKYGISGDGKTAFIEMAAASGLALLTPDERNPLKTTTYGTGELMIHALDHQCQHIIIGIGGSATIDCGVGMAQALGVRFMDSGGRETGPGGENLKCIHNLDMRGLDKRISKCKIEVACDVTTALWGETGAARVFGPQKGANEEMVEILDNGLRAISDVIKKELKQDVDQLSGGGAAGGMGAGLAVFAGGRLRRGFDMAAQYTNLEKHIKAADLIVTGEGKMDGQTWMGKTPAGVVSLAKLHHKPVIGFTGWLEDEQQFLASGFIALIPIADQPMTLSYSLKNAGTLLERAAERCFRLIAMGKSNQ